MNPSLKTLLDQLRQGDLETSIQASLALTQMGAPAVDPLIAIIRDANARGSWWLAAQALGIIGDKRAVPALIAILRNPLSFDTLLARKYTVYALGRLADPQAIDVLIEMLHERSHEEEEEDDGSITVYDEPDYETIEAAAGALAQIGAWRGIEAVINRLLEATISGSTIRWANGEAKPLFNSCSTHSRVRMKSDGREPPRFWENSEINER